MSVGIDSSLEDDMVMYRGFEKRCNWYGFRITGIERSLRLDYYSILYRIHYVDRNGNVRSDAILIPTDDINCQTAYEMRILELTIMTDIIGLRCMTAVLI